MSTVPPVIQVLSRQNYEVQHIVSLPNALPLPSLAPNSLRVKTSVFSLTANNLTYARIGHLLGWWDFHPLPPSIPVEYSDATAFGRISCWGYGAVTESTADIPVGTEVYGYLPIGTFPVDMQVETKKDVPGIFWEISEHRAKLMPLYNKYFFYPLAIPAQQNGNHLQSQAYDSLIRVLFETSYMMNRFVFPWDPKELVHPGLGGGWTFEDSQIGNATLLLFAASGKTGLAFAHSLKHGRPAENKPKTIIGVGSQSSKDFAKSTGLFDTVMEYGDSTKGDLAKRLGLAPDSKVVLCDFGSRDGAASKWAENLKQTQENVIVLGIGGEVVADNPEKAAEKLTSRGQSHQAWVNASGLRDGAMKLLGEKKYTEDFLRDWESCKEEGFVKGIKLIWGEGMEDVGRGWTKLCKGEVGADEGLVFKLS